MNLFTKSMLKMSEFAALTWPLADKLAREKLEIDENQSLWATYTPDYRPTDPLREPISADLVIIGGGFTGTSTAYHFSRRYPEKRVVLLEAKSLGNGASGRNGGMMLNWVTDALSHATPEMTRRVYDVTNEGIDRIIEIINRHQLKVDYRRDGTLEVYTSTERAEAAHEEVEAYTSLGINHQFLRKDVLKKDLNLIGAEGAILDPNGGQLNGAQLTRAMRDVLIEQGVEVYEQTPVIDIKEGREISLSTPYAEVKAKAIVLATNGYTGKLGYFKDALFPLHSHVYATDVISDADLKSMGWNRYAGYSDDYDRISYSVLTSDKHIVFGGGSNNSYAYLYNNRTAYRDSVNRAAKAFREMEGTMQEYLPYSKRFPIKYRWTGTLGITLRRNNLMGVCGEYRNVFYAIGYCGHGVTLANVAGVVLTDAYSGDDERWRGLPFYMPEYGRIPPEPFRWIGYQLFTRLTGKSPRAY
ncbi:FAD-dependent oxidoreductase [Anaerolineales bacterium]